MAKKRALVVIRDAAMIRMASDATRREILRLLSIRPLTQTDLSALLGITTASVGYHLKLLLEAGMIRLEHTTVEKHRIVKKFYETAALHFVIDYESAPLVTRKRSMDMHMERLRGITSLFQMVERKKSRQILIVSDTMEELSEEMANSIAAVGEDHKSDMTELGRETYLTSLYGEVLLHLLHHEKWQALLGGSGSLSTFIKRQVKDRGRVRLRTTQQPAGVEGWQLHSCPLISCKVRRTKNIR